MPEYYYEAISESKPRPLPKRFTKPQPKWKRLHRTDHWFIDDLVSVEYQLRFGIRSMILVQKLTMNRFTRFSYNGKRYKLSISRHRGVK